MLQSMSAPGLYLLALQKGWSWQESRHSNLFELDSRVSSERQGWVGELKIWSLQRPAAIPWVWGKGMSTKHCTFKAHVHSYCHRIQLSWLDSISVYVCMPMWIIFCVRPSLPAAHRVEVILVPCSIDVGYFYIIFFSCFDTYQGLKSTVSRGLSKNQSTELVQLEGYWWELMQFTSKRFATIHHSENNNHVHVSNSTLCRKIAKCFAFISHHEWVPL